MSQKMIKIRGPVRKGELIPTPGSGGGAPRALQAQFYNWPPELHDWKPGQADGRKPFGEPFEAVVTYDRFHRRLIREGSVEMVGEPFDPASQSEPKGKAPSPTTPSKPKAASQANKPGGDA